MIGLNYKVSDLPPFVGKKLLLLCSTNGENITKQMGIYLDPLDTILIGLANYLCHKNDFGGEETIDSK